MEKFPRDIFNHIIAASQSEIKLKCYMFPSIRLHAVLIGCRLIILRLEITVTIIEDTVKINLTNQFHKSGLSKFDKLLIVYLSQLACQINQLHGRLVLIKIGYFSVKCADILSVSITIHAVTLTGSSRLS